MVFLVLVSNTLTFAQRDLEVDYPEIGGLRPEDTSFTLPEYVKYIFNLSLALAGFITFLVFIYGGFKYLTSAGRPAAQKDARDSLFAAILGLIILFCSYLILTTINPQLVFLGLPERTVFPEEPIIPSEPEEEILYYTEIPIGGLVEELFLKDRLDRIKAIFQEIRYKAEEVKILSEDLKTLTDNCSCSNCVEGSCVIGNCTDRANCVSYCQCGADCDPCGSTTREAINQKAAEIEIALSESETERGLIYWQKEFEKEVNDFKQIYQDLERAEELIKECSLSSSERGNSQILLSYNNFWQYRESLEKEKIIKDVEPNYPFDYISSENTYYLANFYCAEIFEPKLPESIEILEFEGIDITEISLEEIKEEIICGDEIIIGETVDNAEELAGQILNEINDVNDSASDEIELAETLIELSEQCDISRCSASMNTGTGICPVGEPESDTECMPPYSGFGGCYESCSECPPGHPICEYFSGMGAYCCYESTKVGNSCTLKDGSRGKCDSKGTCVPTGGRTYCDECECVCSGNACPTEINNTFNRIKANYNRIDSSNEIVRDLIEERVEGFKISEILKDLNTSQYQLKPCYNSDESYMKLGKEKVVWKELFSCSDLKEYQEWGISFYTERGEEVTECYGASPAEPDILDNFFCCETEMF